MIGSPYLAAADALTYVRFLHTDWHSVFVDAIVPPAYAVPLRPRAAQDGLTASAAASAFGTVVPPTAGLGTLSDLLVVPDDDTSRASVRTLRDILRGPTDRRDDVAGDIDERRHADALGTGEGADYHGAETVSSGDESFHGTLSGVLGELTLRAGGSAFAVPSLRRPGGSSSASSERVSLSDVLANFP